MKFSSILLVALSTALPIGSSSSSDDRFERPLGRSQETDRWDRFLRGAREHETLQKSSRDLKKVKNDAGAGENGSGGEITTASNVTEATLVGSKGTEAIVVVTVTSATEQRAEGANTTDVNGETTVASTGNRAGGNEGVTTASTGKVKGGKGKKEEKGGKGEKEEKGGNRAGDTVNRAPNRSGSCGSEGDKKPSVDQKVDKTLIGPDHQSYCLTSSECESCCCFLNNSQMPVNGKPVGMCYDSSSLSIHVDTHCLDAPKPDDEVDLGNNSTNLDGDDGNLDNMTP